MHFKTQSILLYVNEEKEESSAETPLLSNSIDPPKELKNTKDDHPPPTVISEPSEDPEAPFITVTKKRGRPRKTLSPTSQPTTTTTPIIKNKWNLSPPLPGTGSMMTRSQTRQTVQGTLSAINTNVPRNVKDPCFCGNQRLLKNHSSNCKQQMLNWVLTGDTYTTLDDWAHETECIDELEEEEEVPQPQHDETGYRGSSDIDPDEVQEEKEEEEQ